MSVYEPPSGVIAALEARLEQRPRAALIDSARRLSEAYRARRPTQEAIRDETDALAYALTRMPATYAATMAALEQLAERRPDFAPQGVLDIGCGLGAAAYAASAMWPAVETVTLIDRSRPFLDLAKALAAESGVDSLARAAIVTADLGRLPPAAEPASLVVASYALTELHDGALPPLADALWSRSTDALVIIEPGTPRNYQRLMTVRAQLVSLGATILAPCPHNGPCPLEDPDWCHFSVRLPRRRAHRLLKEAKVPYVDEKFAYLVAARSGAPARARILAPARPGKPGITLKLCVDNAISESCIPKRDKARYERIRKKDWGDGLNALPEDTV